MEFLNSPYFTYIFLPLVHLLSSYLRRYAGYDANHFHDQGI